MKDAIRLGLDRIVAGLLRAQGRPYPLAAGTVLVVAPHSDDETLGCGGLIASRASGGHPVHVVFVSDSAAPHPSYGSATREAVATRRRTEALGALQVLGVSPSCAHFLDAPDGRLDRLDAAGSATVQGRLGNLLGSLRPTEVFVPFLGGGSTEHDATYWLVRAAVAAAGRPAVIWEYPVWAWWNPLRLRRQLFHPAENFHLALGPWQTVKRAALARHASQMEPAGAPALPAVLAAACTGPVEHYFHRAD